MIFPLLVTVSETLPRRQANPKRQHMPFGEFKVLENKKY